MSDILYWVWLQNVLGYGCATANAVLEKDISPRQIYEMRKDELLQLGIFKAQQIAKIKSVTLDNANKTLEECQKRKYSIITPENPAYPNRFRNIHAPPLVLYVIGNFENLDSIPTIAIVGTRNMSDYGKKVALDLSYHLAEVGFVIVSGIAVGIDAQAHRGTIKANGKSIAIVGGGLDKNYPVENWKLRDEIVQKGAIISEYPPGTPCYGWNFPVRNRLISGLSLGVIVVEGSSRSGAMITANHALSQGKDVFAVPTGIYSANGEGTLQLIKDGAKPVTNAMDIIEEYSYHFGEGISKTKSTHTTEKDAPVIVRKDKGKSDKIKPCIPKKPLPDLKENQTIVYQLLTDEPLLIDEIIAKSGLLTNQVLSTLTVLEIYGLIRAYPGKRYARNN